MSKPKSPNKTDKNEEAEKKEAENKNPKTLTSPMPLERPKTTREDF